MTAAPFSVGLTLYMSAPLRISPDDFGGQPATGLVQPRRHIRRADLQNYRDLGDVEFIPGTHQQQLAVGLSQRRQRRPQNVLGRLRRLIRVRHRSGRCQPQVQTFPALNFPALVRYHIPNHTEEPQPGLFAGGDIGTSPPRDGERLRGYIVSLGRRVGTPPREPPHVVEIVSEETAERLLVQYNLRMGRACSTSVHVQTSADLAATDRSLSNLDRSRPALGWYARVPPGLLPHQPVEHAWLGNRAAMAAVTGRVRMVRISMRP